MAKGRGKGGEELPYIKDTEAVRNLSEEVKKLEAAQNSMFSRLTTSGDAYSDMVDQAKALLKEQQKSLKSSQKNQDLAKNQVKAASIMLGMGKKQSFVQKAITKNRLKQLKATRQQQDIEDDVTDSMIEQMEAQEEGIDVAAKMNSAVDAADSAFAGMGSTIKDFVTNPIVGIIGLVTAFGAAIDGIGEKFGAIGVTKYKEDLMDSRKEFVNMGMEADDAYTAVQGLTGQFSIGTKAAIEMADSVGDIAKSLGISIDTSAQLLGYFTEVQGYSEQTGKDLIKSVASLAEANDVAPNAVLEDIAANAELFAKFAQDGGVGLSRAAIQAKKLGISLSVVGDVAEGLLDFQNSLNAEMQASVIIGRNLNLQKARELSLTGDMEGLQNEILNIIGDEAEWNEMNFYQRQAMAKALNMNITDLDKMIRKEKEQVTLAGKLADQDLSKMIPEESISAVAEIIADMKVFGMELMEEFGEPFMEGIKDLVPHIKSILEGLMGWIQWLGEGPGIMNVIMGIMSGMLAKSVAMMAIQFALTYAKGASNLGVGTLVALAAMPFVIGGLVASIVGMSKSAGDMFSPANGKTTVSTKEGGLFSLSKNDDLVAAPGIADQFQSKSSDVVGKSPIEGTSTTGASKEMHLRQMDKQEENRIRSRDRNKLQDSLNTANKRVIEENMKPIDKKIELTNKRMEELNKMFADSFGVQGSAAKDIGSEVGRSVANSLSNLNFGSGV
jgi:hypothetical protein